MAGIQVDGETYTHLQINFVNEYLVCYNGTMAYKAAGYQPKNDNVAAVQAHHLLKTPKIAKLIRRRLETDLMSKEEVIQRLARMARGFDVGAYVEQRTSDDGKTITYFDFEKMKVDGIGYLVKSVTNQRGGHVKFEFYNAEKALETLARHHALLVDVLVNYTDDLTDEHDIKKRRERITDLLEGIRDRGKKPSKAVKAKGET